MPIRRLKFCIHIAIAFSVCVWFFSNNVTCSVCARVNVCFCAYAAPCRIAHSQLHMYVNWLDVNVSIALCYQFRFLMVKIAHCWNQKFRHFSIKFIAVLYIYNLYVSIYVYGFCWIWTHFQIKTSVSKMRASDDNSVLTTRYDHHLLNEGEKKLMTDNDPRSIISMCSV